MKRCSPLPALLFALGAAVTPLHGQAPTEAVWPDSSLAALSRRLSQLANVEVPPLSRGVPGVSAYVPTAHGGRWGSIGFGVQYVNRQRFSPNPDGAVGVGIPLGDPARLGLDVGVAILDTRRDNGGGFGQRGSFAAKVHRSLGKGTAVAVGLEHFLNWGNTDTPMSIYGVATTRIALLDPERGSLTRMYLSGGFGHGRFGPEVATGNSFGSFWSVSADLHRAVEGFVEWSGQDLGAGVSLVPHPALPLVITPGMVDLTRSAGDGARFFLSVGTGFSLR